jgi:hypothetical protein
MPDAAHMTDEGQVLTAAPELLAHVGAEGFCGPSGRGTCPAFSDANAPGSSGPRAVHMIGMNAYDRQLQSAIEHLDNMNPMFDFAGADLPTQARQLKTWWGRALADDHIHGHDPAGPVAATDDLNDRQTVLLSAIQRGARGRTGNWTATASASHSEDLALTVSGDGLSITARTSEGKSGVSFPEGISAAADGTDPQWLASMLYRTTHLIDPVVELIDTLALSAAFAGSPFAAQAAAFRRTSPDTLETDGGEITLDWQELTVISDESVSDSLAAAAGISGADVPAALSDVLRTAIQKGHSVPASPTRRIMPEASQSAAGVVSDGAAILAGPGIDVGDATIIGIPPGGSMSIGIGASADGGLSISGLPAAGTAPFIDPEEAFMEECAKSIGIPVDTLRDIVKGEEA